MILRYVLSLPTFFVQSFSLQKSIEAFKKRMLPFLHGLASPRKGPFFSSFSAVKMLNFVRSSVGYKFLLRMR
jgi:hypothetical protein